MSVVELRFEENGRVLRGVAAPTPSPVPYGNDLLRIENFSVRFPGRHGPIHAVRGISLSVRVGECLGIVGESGCGKSTLCSAVLSLLPDNAQIEGRIHFNGSDVQRLSPEKLARLRGREIAMIFQDPMGSLNPVRRIGAQIADKLMVHKGLSRTAARAEAVRLLDLVQMPAAQARLNDYPHELSGGMCQRTMIAMALSCQPKLLIADEPTTALDVTIQAQILTLLSDLRRELGMAIILVSHDLGVIAQTSDRIAVMYSGEIVEEAATETLLDRPRHPYTRGLIDASPDINRVADTLVTIPGSVASLSKATVGCAFAPRCQVAQPKCLQVAPHRTTTSSGAVIACHFPLRMGE